MKKSVYIILPLLLLAVCFQVACTPPQIAVETAIYQTQAAASTSTPTQTQIPTETPTPFPTDTSTPISTPISTSSPSGDGLVRIRIQWDSKITLSVRDDILLFGVWAACSSELTNDWIDNAQTSLVLTEELSKVGIWALSEGGGSQYWNEPHSCTYCFKPQDICIESDDDFLLVTDFEYIFRIPDPGDYVMHVRIELKTPLTDGADWYPDGTKDGIPDIYEGVITERTIAIHVTD